MPRVPVTTLPFVSTATQRSTVGQEMPSRPEPAFSALSIGVADQTDAPALEMTALPAWSTATQKLLVGHEMAWRAPRPSAPENCQADGAALGLLEMADSSDQQAPNANNLALDTRRQLATVPRACISGSGHRGGDPSRGRTATASGPPRGIRAVVHTHGSSSEPPRVHSVMITTAAPRRGGAYLTPRS